MFNYYMQVNVFNKHQAHQNNLLTQVKLQLIRLTG